MKKELLKNIICIVLPISYLLTGCGEDKNTLDSKLLNEQCDTGHGYSCYKIASMHANLDLFPNTLDKTPNAAEGAYYAREACDNGDQFGCSLYYNFIDVEIPKEEVEEQLTKSCNAGEEGSFLSCANLLKGNFIKDKAKFKEINDKAFDLAINECKTSGITSAQSCYFASKVLSEDLNRINYPESARLLYEACEIGLNYGICKEASKIFVNGKRAPVDYAKYEHSFTNALKPYATLCDSNQGKQCGEYIIKQKELIMALYLRGIELTSMVRERPYIPTFVVLLDEYNAFKGDFIKKIEAEERSVAKKGCSLKNQKSCQRLSLINRLSKDN